MTIQRRGTETREEFRIRGRLYMVKVTPAHGVSYYLIDENGRGDFTRQDSYDTGTRVPGVRSGSRKRPSGVMSITGGCWGAMRFMAGTWPPGFAGSRVRPGPAWNDHGPLSRPRRPDAGDCAQKQDDNGLKRHTGRPRHIVRGSKKSHGFIAGIKVGGV